MKKGDILIFISIIIIFFFATFFIFLLQKPKPRYLTDISKLYAQFTPYMKTWVDSHLERIHCKPSEFYITPKETSKEVCFICDKLEVCFGYATVQREGGRKMNPYGEYYVKSDKINLNIADFYTDELASLFNCKNENEKTLKCDFNLNFVLKEKGVDIIIKDKNELPNISRLLCQKRMKTEKVECIESICHCKNLVISVIGEKLIISD
jgi:hypothetical protein